MSAEKFTEIFYIVDIARAMSFFSTRNIQNRITTQCHLLCALLAGYMMLPLLVSEKHQSPTLFPQSVIWCVTFPTLHRIS